MIVASKWRGVGLLLGLIFMPALLLVALFMGSVDIPFAATVAVVKKSLLGIEAKYHLRPWMETVLIDVRLPRVIVAALVGGGLALAGAVMQGLFRNPLASPTILGVSSGASLGAVLAIFTGISASVIWALPMFAFIGAAATMLLVYSIANHQGQMSMATLLLAGVAVNALNTAVIALITALSFSNFEVSRMILYWTMGGLDARLWDHVGLLLPFVVVGLVVILAYSRDLDNLMMGDLHAVAVGVNVDRARKILLLVTAALIGGAVSVSGGIGFIGLVIPHLMRILIGPAHRFLLPYSFLAGALFLVLADLLLRSLFADQLIPLGVLTAMVGGPFFLFLLMKSRIEQRL